MAGQTEDGRAPAGRRLDVLRVLRDASGPLSIGEIAEQLGVHPNTVRFHLATLTTSGQVEHAASDRSRPGRPPLLFRAVRGMDPTGPRHYRVLAEILTNSLAADPHPRARAVEAGRAWGRQLTPPTDDNDNPDSAVPREPLDRLISLLDGLGFAPERRDNDGQMQVGLRHCPFLDLAESRAQVICPIHLGLMQGALEAWESPVTVDRLEEFVEPDLCLAHLTSVGRAS